LIDSLYAIVDAEVSERPLATAFQALNAGCAIIQLRAKRLDDVAFLEIATRVRSACTHASIPFVVNDRADIARLVRADGLLRNTRRVLRIRLSLVTPIASRNVELSSEASAGII
jgi:hypothetical protein